MIKLNKIAILLAFALGSSAVSAQDNLARPGFVRDTTPPVLGADPDVGFADVQDLLDNQGWEIVNTSDDPGGATNPVWFQGNPAVFAAQAGADDSYAAANFNATGGSMISMWLLVPDVGFLDNVSFWTRTATGSTFPDGMEVRFSAVGGNNVGTDVNTFGDYDVLLEDINTALVAGGYPEDWTEFNVQPMSEGRLAFRYLVDTDAGPVGANSNFIGVDSVTFTIGAPAPLGPEVVPTLSVTGLIFLMMIMIGAAFFGLRKRGNTL